MRRDLIPAAWLGFGRGWRGRGRRSWPAAGPGMCRLRSEEASATRNIFVFNLQVEYAEQARACIRAALGSHPRFVVPLHIMI